jgi:radical SAM superfamily enzyme YgiQ (UPF0313 family)
MQKSDSSKHKARDGREQPLRVLLVYPNTTAVALANLGFQRVYTLLNGLPGVMCDRYSLPDGWSPGVARLAEADLRSADSDRRPRDFDMIAFSISFEPDYLHVAAILHYFGIPLGRDERGAEYPLIAAGGSAVFINPEPLADICDVFFIGEAEGLVAGFFSLYADRRGDDRHEVLARAGVLPGIYVPELYSAEFAGDRQTALVSRPGVPARVRRHVAELPADLCTHSTIHGEGGAFKNMALLEVTRGCIWACRFCTAGFIYRPPREPDLLKTYDSLRQSLGAHAVSTVGLVGPSVTDHPGLPALARRIVEDGKKLSFSSLRMETLTEELVDLMLRSGQKTLTVAVDGPSERMRRVINKAATDAFIIEKCRFLTERGVLHLKIYSIVGLPGETEEDIDSFIALIEAVSREYVEARRRRGNIGQLTVSLSPLIPKPGTPFQWHPMERVDVLRHRFARLRKALGRLPNMKLGFGSPHEAYLQTYLSRGDRRLLSFFRSYLECGQDAKRALKNAEPHPDGFVYRQYEADDFLPWDVVDHGYFNRFLWQDYQRGLKEAPTPVCDTAVCKICGIC